MQQEQNEPVSSEGRNDNLVFTIPLISLNKGYLPLRCLQVDLFETLFVAEVSCCWNTWKWRLAACWAPHRAHNLAWRASSTGSLHSASLRSLQLHQRLQDSGW